MSVGLIHGIAASLIPLIALFLLFGRNARILALINGALAIVTLLTGISSQRAFEPAYRRHVYLVAEKMGPWLDRKSHLGIAACAFAIAGALVANTNDSPRWLRQLLWVLTGIFGLAALVISLWVHTHVAN